MWTDVRGALAAMALLAEPGRSKRREPLALALPEPCPESILNRWALRPERAALVLSLWGEDGRCRVQGGAPIVAEPEEPALALWRPASEAAPAGVAALHARLTEAGYRFAREPAVAPRLALSRAA
jgi:hypothetical protein